MVETRLLHSGGLVCILGGSVCLANLGGSCLHSGGSWRPGIPSLVSISALQLLKINTVDRRLKKALLQMVFFKVGFLFFVVFLGLVFYANSDDEKKK